MKCGRIVFDRLDPVGKDAVIAMEFSGPLDILLALGVILLFIVFLVLNISWFVYAMTIVASRFVRLRKMPQDSAESCLTYIGDDREWAESNNFEFVGCYILGGGRSENRIAAWRNRERPTFFSVTGSRHQFTTLFAGRAYLKTGQSWTVNAYLSPPWAYSQDCPDRSPDELWDKHLEGENYLNDEGGAELAESEVQFEEWISESRDQGVAYMRSFPFWPFRIYGWLFRGLMRNDRGMDYVSIQQQHEWGWVRLPNEIQGR